MAVARKCDRCGVYYDEYNVKNNAGKINGIVFANIVSQDKYYSRGLYDLCPACSDELMKWFRKENINA